MTPDESLDQHRRSLEEIGETVLVRRYAGVGPARAVAKEAAVLARVKGYQPAELVGEIRQGDRHVILLNDPSAGVPAGKVALSTMLPLTDRDFLVIAGAEVSIKGVDDATRRIQGQVIAFELQVRG
ncbi:MULTISPECIES: hypothetical protein [unclassified Bradyrhizobium]|uniref:hypothetical protein n=1 Tax=unclassified Bradyrhizobium TaxID=2631580 RepID=UPI001BAAF7EF|nr:MULTISPECIES: hypothetical protein [unclassified Bradyrhizobium]WLA52372.1 hypothetical protein QIH80_21130 [Bradyrhizobium elkanii]MBR1206963.1 hypothetical protein [Bradyrhizobium sp. AUGA SZCCT0124]MBR1313502.1 hypothetical protein [Bradyrhizobium sp. AUGA SZCCT0051]MBR1343401.1 hypothetical protein [Bradyrhizobium sp. AUGA SZCCT0105]MBR1357179.1 hypothetical protein [Bradyrhizobium sp. AUGA SZCCT0045]